MHNQGTDPREQGQFAEGLTRALALLLAICLVPIILFSVRLIPVDNSGWLFALVSLIIFWLFYANRKTLVQIPERVFLIALVLIFTALRLAWILIMPTLPTSDFTFYYNIAARINILRPLTDIPWQYINRMAYGYPVILGVWFMLTSQTLLAAKLFNLVLGIASLLVFFRISSYFGLIIGRLAALLFILWPAHILYSSVLGSEHLGLFTMLCAIWFLFKIIDPSSRNKWAGAIAGLFFGITYVTRAPLFGVFLWGLVCVLLSAIDMRRKLFQIGSIILAFIAAIGLFYVTIRTFYGVWPVSNSLITLLTGTDYDSIGYFTPEGAAEYLEYETVEEANAYAWEVAKDRIFNHPGEFLTLVLRKIPKMWGDDGYGYYWSTVKLSADPPYESFESTKILLESIPRYFRTMVLALSLVGCARIVLKKYSNPYSLFLIGAIFAGMAVHSVFEIQPRYQIPYAPFLIILAVIGFMGFAAESQAPQTVVVDQGEPAG